MANKADRARRSTSISPDAEDRFLRIAVAAVALALAAIPLVYWTSLAYGFSIPNVTVFRLTVAALCLLGFVWLAGGPTPTGRPACTPPPVDRATHLCLGADSCFDIDAVIRPDGDAHVPR